MRHQVWFDKEQDVLREKFLGGFTEEDVPHYLARVREVYGSSKHHKVIVDLSEARQPFYDRRTRQLLIEGAGRLRYKEERVAMLKASPDIRMLIKVLVAGMRQHGKDVEARFFESEAEALGWLKDGGEE